MDLLYQEESYAIRGAIFEVYNEVGPGFLEAVYQECLEKEMTLRSIPYETQKEIRIHYKNELLHQSYKPDFLCYNKIIVEIKAVKKAEEIHKAQVFNYLKASGLRLGLLVNFGHFPKVTIDRIVL